MESLCRAGAICEQLKKNTYTYIYIEMNAGRLLSMDPGADGESGFLREFLVQSCARGKGPAEYEYIYIYIYTDIHTHTYIHIYIYAVVFNFGALFLILRVQKCFPFFVADATT